MIFTAKIQYINSERKKTTKTYFVSAYSIAEAQTKVTSFYNNNGITLDVLSVSSGSNVLGVIQNHDKCFVARVYFWETDTKKRHETVIFGHADFAHAYEDIVAYCNSAAVQMGITSITEKSILLEEELLKD